MKIPEQYIRCALTVMGKVNDPHFEAVVVVGTQDHSIWWHLWNVATHPREMWLGFMDGIHHPENYR